MIDISKEDLEYLIFTENLSYIEIGKKLGCSSSYVTKYARKIGINLIPRRKVNSCENFNKNKKLKSIKYCLNCGSVIKSHNTKYCSNKCQQEFQNKIIINRWKSGEFDGVCKYMYTRPLKKYMLEKVGYKCELCGWNKINIKLGYSPLQLHHIDGNPKNNDESNLQILCPNCHSLTENFMGLNNIKNLE